MERRKVLLLLIKKVLILHHLIYLLKKVFLLFDVLNDVIWNVYNLHVEVKPLTLLMIYLKICLDLLEKFMNMFLVKTSLLSLKNAEIQKL